MPPVLAALAALGACAGSRPDLGSESRPLGLDEGRLSALGANASKPLEERTYNFQPIGQTCNFLNSWCKLTPGKTLRPGLQVGSFEKRVTEGYLIKVYSDFNDAKDAAEEMKEFTSKKIRHSVAFCQYGTLSYTYGPFFINWKEVRHALVLQEGEPKGDAQLSEGPSRCGSPTMLSMPSRCCTRGPAPATDGAPTAPAPRQPTQPKQSVVVAFRGAWRVVVNFPFGGGAPLAPAWANPGPFASLEPT